ncbi:hypothetical protein [Enterococcus avium]|uniref:hypothetical protein n=1 Tax=Enterococcus avium TaxID=33945 RepID=UPI001C111A36|nr:hypothetical protein [Enterococcus avium]MBU5370055.1 hypothetical protein [Enterococcus avium]
MIAFLENMMIAAFSIFLVYVGRDHFVATVVLILAVRSVCFASDFSKRPFEGEEQHENI